MSATGEELPALSTVIPTSRGGADLDACLASLRDQDYGPHEVIVVDNGAGLDTLAARYPDLRVLRNERNEGFATACNQGIEAAGGELVLLLNDDTVVEPGALRHLVDALVSRPAWGACQAKLVLLDDPSRLDSAGSFLTSTGFLVHRGVFGPANRFTVSDVIFAAKGAALLVRRAALEDAGVFDPDSFAYFEETDLCWRLWLAGWEVGFVADAIVRHGLGRTASELPSELVQFHSFKNRICALLKNLGPERLAWMLPYHLALCTGLAAWFALRGRGDLGRAIVRAIVWNARHLRATRRKRAEIQSSRRIDDRELMPRIAKRTSLRRLFGYAEATVGGADD